MKLALDLTHCSHSSAQTGIQQVARGLWKSLPARASLQPLVYDKYAGYWRPIDAREERHLTTIDAVGKVKRKRPHWSTWQRIRGRMQKQFGMRREGHLGDCDAALIPEFFAEWVGPRLPELKQRIKGPLVAVFHDAIAFNHPQWGVPSTIERYPQYLGELAKLDGVACVSDYSRQQLLESFLKIKTPAPPNISVIPLGLRIDHLSGSIPPASLGSGETLTFLTVATIEPRKNHPALLEAAESLWQRGFEFRLILVGMLNRGNGQPIEAIIRRLQSEGRPIEWLGSVAAGELAGLYQSADATVFPSLCEGFGLPVLESLYFNKPCLASNGGALAEVVPGGGTLIADPTAAGMAALMETFLASGETRARLTEEATRRRVRTMDDYAADLVSFIQEQCPASGE